MTFAVLSGFAADPPFAKAVFVEYVVVTCAVAVQSPRVPFVVRGLRGG